MSNWAMIIGINQYPSLPDQQLRGAVADACDFAEWALDPAGGNVPAEQLHFWAHPWPDEVGAALAAYLAGDPPKWDNPFLDWAPADRTRPPTAAEIIHTAERNGRTLHESGFGQNAPVSRMLVFVAGHGLRTTEIGDTSQQTCFIAGDFRPANSSAAEGLVPCDSLRRSLRNDRFDEVLLFFDCCRNDFPVTSIRAVPLCDYQGDKEEPHWSIGSAAGDNKRAYETPAPPYRGAFSKTLVEGLRTARDVSTGALAVDGLARYVSDNIARATNTGQAPEFRYEPRAVPLVIVAGGGAPLVIGKPGPLVRLNNVLVGSNLVLRGGDDRPLAGKSPVAVTGETVQLPDLPDGLYSIEPEGAPERAVLFKQPRDNHVEIL